MGAISYIEMLPACHLISNCTPEPSIQVAEMLQPYPIPALRNCPIQTDTKQISASMYVRMYETHGNLRCGVCLKGLQP